MTERGHMSSVVIPRDEWIEFLQGFDARHAGGPVHLETHDRETGETVVSRDMPLNSIELDTEDEKNPRINVIVSSGEKVFKHILFRPSGMTLHLSGTGSDEALEIHSLNTITTVRFHNGARGGKTGV